VNVTWRDDALCEPLPDEAKAWFFAGGETGTSPEGVQQQHQWASMVCYECPVQLTCLRYCVETGSAQDGVWGGLTQPQRKRYLRGHLDEEAMEDVLFSVGKHVLRKLEEGERPPIPGMDVGMGADAEEPLPSFA
jgi:hypothetical protein